MYKLIVLLCSVFVSVFSCNSSNKSSEANLTKETNGKGIYKTYCQGCHGLELQNFSNLDWRERLSFSQTFRIVKNGQSNDGMPAFEQALTDEQINQVVHFILQYEEDKAETPPKLQSTTHEFDVIVDGLEIPWAMEFLPNGDILISERQGKLYRWTTNNQLTPISGLPPIWSKGQGGLMDIKLHPNYIDNGWLYLSFSYVDEKKKNASNTAIMRARLNGNQLVDQEQIYRGVPAVASGVHFGSRMVFDQEGYLYFSNGDRGKRDQFPQQLNNSNGKIHRLHDDGKIPSDNPFVDYPDAIPSIFSYGHRNPQGLARHPSSGEIWESEHGPRGGDEINIIKKAKNYGWPVISYGINYDGTTFTELTAKEGMEQPIYYYDPSIAPCGMTFVSTNRYGADWQNSILLGSLSFRYLERIQFDDDNHVVKREKLLEELNSRVRDVRESPDGLLYVALENPGRIIRLLPQE